MRYVILILILCFIPCTGATGLPTECASGAHNTEPPGPWEPYSAILSADLVVKGELFGSPEYDIQNEWYTAPFRIDSLLNRQIDNVSAGDTITIRLPTPREMGALQDKEKGSIPEFFNKHTHFYAALKYDGTNSYYYSSSAWAYLSFLVPKEKHRLFISEVLARCHFTKREAEALARTRFGSVTGQLSIDVIGGKINGRQFTPTSDVNDPEAKLVWRIINPKNLQQYLFVTISDGTELTLD